ncbi:MAG: urease accessory protein UreF [Synechococcaceae cyanobacterium SM2_3_1]|nr:urease accessory protein UreF [Synechococcaceae cyanobacterium SM2_3_1]
MPYGQTEYNSFSPKQADQELIMMQLADSFFPSGTFTFSHGLEGMVQKGYVQSPEHLLEMLTLTLQQKLGPCELVALIHAHQASSAENIALLKIVEQVLWTHILVEEARETLRRSGQALLRVAATVWPDQQLQQLSDPESFYGLHPIVFAVVGRATGLDAHNTGLAYVHAYITGIVGAAIRLGIIGHIRAQQIRWQLTPCLQEICNDACQTDLESLWSFYPRLDITQMNYCYQEQRLFAN